MGNNKGKDSAFWRGVNKSESWARSNLDAELNKGNLVLFLCKIKEGNHGKKQSYAGKKCQIKKRIV